MRPTKFFFVATAIALSFAFLNSNRANATPFIYTISSSPTNAMAGPGQLNPGTLTGSFSYDSTSGTFSAASLDIAGVQSCNLNGNYVLDTGTTSTSTDLRVQGTTSTNSCFQSNTNSYLDINFAAALGGSSDQIMLMSSFQGNQAYFTTPPTVAYADVPEPSSLFLLGSALILLGSAIGLFPLGRRVNRDSGRGQLGATAQA